MDASTREWSGAKFYVGCGGAFCWGWGLGAGGGEGWRRWRGDGVGSEDTHARRREVERYRVSAAWTERWAAGDFHADALYRGFVHGPGNVLCEAWLRVCAGGCAGTRKFRRGV